MIAMRLVDYDYDNNVNFKFSSITSPGDGLWYFEDHWIEPCTTAHFPSQLAGQLNSIDIGKYR